MEDNLRTLGVEQLGAVNLRRMLEHDVVDEQRVPLADQLAEMVALREEGKIAGVGISTAPLAEIDEAISSAQITCVQNEYSLLARDDGGVLDRCIAAGIAFVPYFPLGSAFPGMPKVTDDARVQAVAARLGATPAQVGLAWLLARPTTSCSSRARRHSPTSRRTWRCATSCCPRPIRPSSASLKGPAPSPKDPVDWGDGVRSTRRSAGDVTSGGRAPRAPPRSGSRELP